MSASSKKKLRKEESAAMMTDKQRQEQAESKKLRAYTITFVVVILAVVIAAAAIWGVTMVNRAGIHEKNTIAATVDGRDLNSVMMNYYYCDTVNKFRSDLYNSYGDNAPMYATFMGLDMSKPLDEQKFGDEGSTWADHFMEMALEQAKRDFALEKQAAADNYIMSEAGKADLDMGLSQLEAFAKMYGYKDAKQYLSMNYGPGSNMASYTEYTTRSALANDYQMHYTTELKYEDADIREYEKDKYDNYSTFTYANYYLSASSFLEGGTTAEDGTVTYSDAEKEASVQKAKEAAEELAQCKTVEELDKAIAALPVNKEVKDAATTKAVDTFYESIPAPMNKWLADDARKEGDIAALASELKSTDEDGKETTTVGGYYVVLFQGRNDNLNPLANVRHILVKFQGGTAGENGTYTYSDTEKAAAKEAAEAILAEWKKGDMTEDSFAALAKEKSEDPGSKEEGGLIEDITPATRLVPNFLSWSIDESRKAGDTGIVETEYGYHVMYYSGDDELTYRDFMIENDLRQKDTEEWLTGLMDTITAELGKTSYIRTDYIMAR